MITQLRVLLFLSALCLFGTIDAQKFVDYGDREILPEEIELSHRTDNSRVSDITGHPLNIRGMQHKVTTGSPEAMAREYLVDNHETLGLTTDLINNNLSFIAIRHGLSGDVVRLQQHYDGIPVYNGQITIHINKKSEVTYVANSWKYGLDPSITRLPNISSEDALAGALEQTKVLAPTTFKDEQLMIYINPISNVSALVYRHLISGQDYTGEWETITDARTGQIIKSQNLSYNCKTPGHQHDGEKNPPKKEKAQAFFADGQGNIFDPDPLTSGTATYGDPGYTDNGDNNSPQMTGELVNVTLRDITETAGTFELKGPWAEIIDHDPPFKGLFTQPSSTFNYDRTDDNFEAVMVYYHIDASMRYLNETLGLMIKPTQYTTGVRVDPSGWNGADNSSYNTGTGRLSFGEGGVDDAEDSDVIHHELGHGLHDWVTNGSLSQVNGLSEGCGDYWAASYNRSFDNWTPSDPAYFHTFRWDGHNQFWGGRSVNYRPNAPNQPYPGGLVGQIHTDGQIWATCMMDVWDGLGKTKTDIIFWEGLGMTNGSTNQDDAANAVYQAAVDMNFPRSELMLIHAPLEACGYDLPDLPALPDCTENGDIDLLGVVTMDTMHLTPTQITSGQTISGGADVLYQAGTQVNIDSLQVDNMSKLMINIEDCTTTTKQ